MKKRFALYVVVICLLAVSFSSCGNDDLELNSEYFTELEAEKVDVQWLKNRFLSGETYCYNGPAFELDLVQGELCLKKFEADGSHLCNLSYYYFIGVDNGEFGGGIMCAKYGELGENASLEYVSRENCRGFLRPYVVSDGLEVESLTECYAFAGVTHMGIDEGMIYKSTVSETGYTFDEFAKLDSCPDAFVMDGDDMIVATRKSLVSVDEDGNVTELFDAEYWEDLHINSIVIADGCYYLGASSGILKYVIETNDAVWYPYYNVE